MRIFQLQTVQQLEQLPLQVRRSLSSQFPWFWQAFLGFWHMPPREPRIQRKIEHSGKTYWQVYEPIKDRTICFDDEQRMLSWLDEGHYRRARPDPWNLD